LKKLLKKHYNPKKLSESGVKFIVGACSLNTGSYVSTIGNVPNVIDWVMASSSFPFAFPPIEIDGQLFTDGGIKNYVPILDVLGYCEPKEIDAIVTSPIEYEEGIVEHEKTKKIDNIVKLGVR